MVSGPPTTWASSTRPQARQHHDRVPRGREVVKVVDFGIAKAGTAERDNRSPRPARWWYPGYMSLEQLSGDKVDGRSDIYSLALVFCRMITDTLPFVADTAQETMIKRLTDEPIPLAQARRTRRIRRRCRR